MNPDQNNNPLGVPQPPVSPTQPPVGAPVSPVAPQQPQYIQPQPGQTVMSSANPTLGQVAGQVTSPLQQPYTQPQAQPGGARKILKTIVIIILGIVILFFVWILGIAAKDILFGSNKSSPKISNVNTASTQYADNQAGFKITLPAGWGKVATQGSDVADFKYSHPDVVSSTENYSPFINVVSGSSQGASLSALVSANEQGLSQQSTNFNLISSTPETISGQPATLLVYSLTLQGLQLQDAQLLLINNGTAWGVTGASLASTWSQHSSDIKSSLLSFQFE